MRSSDKSSRTCSRLAGACAVLFLACPIAAAQTAPSSDAAPGLRLLDVVRTALRNHPAVLLQERQVDVSRGLVRQERSSFDTQLGFSAQQSRTSTPRTAAGPFTSAQAGFTAPGQDSKATTYGLNLRKLLRSGIATDVALELTRSADNLFNTTPINYSQLSMQVTLPLLRNRGRVVAAQEVAAEAGLDASHYDLSQTLSERIAGAANAYWGYLAAQKNLEVFLGSEERGRVLLDNALSLIQADKLPRSEANYANANLSDRTASRIKAEQQLIQSTQDLALAMGLDLDKQGLPRPSDAFPDPDRYDGISVAAESIDRYVRDALTRRTDYLAAKKREEATQVVATASRAQLRPEFDLNLNAGFTGLGESARPDQLVRSLVENVQGLNVIVSLRSSFPFANNAARSQVMQSEAGHAQARIRSSEIARHVAAGVAVGAQALRNSALQVKKSREAVAAFQAALEGQRDKLRLGVGSIEDILLIEDRLTSALLAEVSAHLGYAVSVVQFRAATGTFVDPGQPSRAIELNLLLTPPLVPIHPQ